MTREEKIAYCRAWRLVNKDKRVRAGRKYSRTKGFVCAKRMRRIAAELQRMPTWADRQRIAEVYETCPAGFHVDHVIPLRGRTVSGLHVHQNLQHLLATENARKSNHFEGG